MFLFLLLFIEEVDEDEFDSRRAECVSDMKELESQFMKLKEELVNEKLLLIDQKLKEIEDESAEEYTVPCQKLKQNMELKLKLTSTIQTDTYRESVQDASNI